MLPPHGGRAGEAAWAQHSAPGWGGRPRVARLAQNKASRQWVVSLRGQRCQQGPASPVAMIHLQMREERAERRARMQAANGKKRIRSHASTDG
jgi:hypothetical protein